MPGSSSWMPSAPHGVKGFDDDELKYLLSWVVMQYIIVVVY